MERRGVFRQGLHFYPQNLFLSLSLSSITFSFRLLRPTSFSRTDAQPRRQYHTSGKSKNGKQQTYLYIYIYIYIYIYTYTHIYIYIYICSCQGAPICVRIRGKSSAVIYNTAPKYSTRHCWERNTLCKKKKKKKRTKPRHENGGVRRKGRKKGDRKSGGERRGVEEEVAEQVSFHCGIPAATSIET